MSRVEAVIVAAGRGTRVGGGTPKQFLDLGGRSVLDYSIARLAGDPGIEGVVVVLAPEEMEGPHARRIREAAGVRAVVAGGATRMRSVLLGVEAAAGAEIVLVHDAARPFASTRLVAAVIDGVMRHGAAVPVVPVPETVKEQDGSGFVAKTLDRRSLGLAQTPQGARREILLEALRRAVAAGIEATDEAEALERAGFPVVCVPGDSGNLKITTPDDLADARARHRGEERMRIGHGFDVHRFGGERPLVLGGVVFAGERGLLGHSDADVVLHAAMDAVLGAAGLPDIGHRFPPEDPRFAGSDSRELAREVAGAVAAIGFAVTNLDITVLAEAPRIAPRVVEMRTAIADAFDVSAACVGLKATTLEGLGALGRGEGIACHAVALIHVPAVRP